MPKLDVYVSERCFGCAEARRLAEDAARRFPSVAVRVVDVGREPEALPDTLVAVPSYLLDGRVVSLGNPHREELFRCLAQALSSAAGPADRADATMLGDGPRAVAPVVRGPVADGWVPEPPTSRGGLT